MNQPNSMAGQISIVIPCYNDGALLRETLASVERVRNQNVAEVIIVNDGSTDTATLQHLKQLGDAPYRIIHQKNGGLARARNAGVRAAVGEFILPLDSDNFIREAYLKEGVAILRDDPKVGVVYGDAEFFGDKIGPVQIPDFRFHWLIFANYIDACALFRKSTWESVEGYDEQMPVMGFEDWDFWMRTALRGWQFVHLNHIAFDYRVRANSMLRQITQPRREEIKSYLASKREGSLLRVIMDNAFEMERAQGQLSDLKQSKEYRLGRALLKPFRAVQKLFKPPPAAEPIKPWRERHRLGGITDL